jgi:hypothetical protein
MLKRHYHVVLVLGLILALAVSGCGGGSGSGGGSSNTLTCTINSSGSLDGVEFYNYSSLSGTSNYNFECTDSTIVTGNSYMQIPTPPSTIINVYRCLLSFNLSSLAGKSITDAILKVHVTSTTGTPFNNSNLGNLTAAHIDYGITSPPPSQSSQNYFSGFDPATVGSMTTDGQWQVIDVSGEVVADQGKGYTQYRLYFANDTSAMGTNQITIESGDSTVNQPELVVTYK